MWEERKLLGFILVLLAILVQPSRQAKKKVDRSLFVEVSEVKPFKKLQRTHTNLLVLFAKGEKDAKKKFSLLSEVAEEIRGKGTIAIVNCGESKKLCKKLKVSPKPILLKHYKDGKFNKDYDRKDTPKSMLNFMNNPTGDAPWEEEEGAEDVRHVYKSAELQKLLTKERKPIMMMFYAPWCGFCKKFKPDFAAAATELKGESVMGGMDVDTEEGYPVRMKYNITGFPTLIYFSKGQEKYRYSGKHEKDALVEFMKDPTAAPPPPPKEEEWSDTPSEVMHLTDDTFDKTIEENSAVLVMFYAPWCGHCKAMKPEYTKAATTLKDESINGVLAALDATKHQKIGKQYKIEGYPTVKFFKDGQFAFDVNERTADKIVDFMKDPKEPPPPPPPEKPWHEVPSDVLHLDKGTFKSTLKKKKHALVMFYAPWCGHCKAAKPEYVEAAKHHANNNKIAYAAVDCTEHQSLCDTYKVEGFPTLRYFNYGKKDFKYQGGRKSKDFIFFMDDPQEGPPPPPPAKEWSDEPGYVEHLTDDTFDTFVSSIDSVMVMFYAPWCGHCKAMKPDYSKAAEELNNKLSERGQTDGALAAVDCTKHRKIAEKYKIEGYPTLKYFRNGEVASEYTGERTKKGLVDFMLNPSVDAKTNSAEAEPREPEPTAPPPPKELTWADENTDVHHLTVETFDKFLSSHNSVLVMFYAPWCPHCKKLKPAYGDAAKRVNVEHKADGAIAAVDCIANQDVCEKFTIKGYPHFKYFKDGKEEFRYTGRKTADAMVEFMTNPQKPAPPPPPADWSKDGSKVNFLTEETFDEFIASRPSVLVMFFAPWCGYCNSMKQNYYDAANILAKEKPDASLAALDCSRHKNKCKSFKLKGYPTVKQFRNGEAVEDYDGDRSTEDLVRYVNLMDQVPEKDDELKWESVEKLNSDNFDGFAKDKKHLVVMFYAPWCGHCKNAKPKFEDSAKGFESSPDHVFAVVDCNTDSGLCDQHEVNGYPTIRYYHYGQFVVEYDGARETEDFTMFMEEPPKPLPTEKPPVLPDTDTTPDETGDSSSGKRDEL